jgi:hypothetical protein
MYIPVPVRRKVFTVLDGKLLRRITGLAKKNVENDEEKGVYYVCTFEIGSQLLSLLI